MDVLGGSGRASVLQLKPTAMWVSAGFPTPEGYFFVREPTFCFKCCLER